ncbi:MAG: TetR/AcrR family transcriptional regulator [Flavobacteriaceae bacterium]|nr:TetR/AcrR family transcriptional regulator [Flavobacteriaceae bacterium]
MKDIILEKSRELFLTIGFKSVTMDHIANAMGISKKTIYNFFENKTSLVKSVANYMFTSITRGVTEIKKNSEDPISELYDINLFLIKYLKKESTSPLYQLEKYYPLIHKSINKMQFDFIIKSTRESLENGIKLGLFRHDIKIDFISRLYFKGMIGIRDLDTFPSKTYDPVNLKIDFIEYHLRAIVTPKGLKKLNQFINK